MDQNENGEQQFPDNKPQIIISEVGESSEQRLKGQCCTISSRNHLGTKLPDRPRLFSLATLAHGSGLSLNEFPKRSRSISADLNNSPLPNKHAKSSLNKNRKCSKLSTALSEEFTAGHLRTFSDDEIYNIRNAKSKDSLIFESAKNVDPKEKNSNEIIPRSELRDLDSSFQPALCKALDDIIPNSQNEEAYSDSIALRTGSIKENQFHPINTADKDQIHLVLDINLPEDNSSAPPKTKATGSFQSTQEYRDDIIITSDRPSCRICKEEDNLVSPCLCDGSMKWVHSACLGQWLRTRGEVSDNSKCEICQEELFCRRTFVFRPWNVINRCDRTEDRLCPLYFLICFIIIGMMISGLCTIASRAHKSIGATGLIVGLVIAILIFSFFTFMTFVFVRCFAENWEFVSYEGSGSLTPRSFTEPPDWLEIVRYLLQKRGITWCNWESYLDGNEQRLRRELESIKARKEKRKLQQGSRMANYNYDSEEEDEQEDDDNDSVYADDAEEMVPEEDGLTIESNIITALKTSNEMSMQQSDFVVNQSKSPAPVNQTETRKDSINTFLNSSSCELIAHQE